MSKKFSSNEDLVRQIEELYLWRLDNSSQDSRNKGWEKLIKMADGDEHWLDKIEIARDHINSIDFPFKNKVPSWAVEGKDYMIIPDGTKYRSKDINLNPPKKNRLGNYDPNEYYLEGETTVYDYAKEGLVLGEPRALWDGGAGMIFDGENVLLTCNSDLFEETKKAVGAKKDGIYIYFFNSTQHAVFDDIDMDREFRKVISNAEGPHRIPIEDAKMRTLYYQFWKKAGVKYPGVYCGNRSIYIGSYEQRHGELLHKLNEYDKEQKEIKDRIQASQQENQISSPKTRRELGFLAKIGLAKKWCRK